MSIIYGTLARLEAEDPPLANHNLSTGQSPRSDETGSFPLKFLAAAAIAVVLGGASLMLWRENNVASASRSHAPAPVPSAITAVEATDFSMREPGPVASSADTAGPSGPEVPASGAAEEVPRETEQALGAAGIGEESPVSAVGPADIDPVGEPVVVTEASGSGVSAPAPESVNPLAESSRKESTTAGERKQSVEPDDVIEQARIALAGGRYQQSLSDLKSIDPVPADRAEYWFIKGSAHLGLGQLNLAESALASAQQLAPDYAQIRVQQAILEQERGDHVTALRILSDAAEQHPGVPEIFLNKGYSEQALGATQDAKRSFRTFLRMTQSRSLYSRQREAVEEWLTQVSYVET